MAREIGYGTSLQASSTAVFVSIGFVRSLTGPGASVPAVDMTAFDSTEAREFLPGVPDYGQISAQIVWDPVATTSHQSLRRWFLTRETVNWKIVHPTTTTVVTFNGFVQNLEPRYEVDDVLINDLIVKITGKANWP